MVKYSREGKVIVEKYIEGPEVSVNGYMVNGVMRFLIVSDRDTWPEYTGLIHKHIVPSKAVCNTANSKIKRIVEDACNRIGILNGPVYFQMKVMNGHPYIIEMTFTNGSGFEEISPIEADLMLGDLWKIKELDF